MDVENGIQRNLQMFRMIQVDNQITELLCRKARLTFLFTAVFRSSSVKYCTAVFLGHNLKSVPAEPNILFPAVVSDAQHCYLL